VSSKYTGITPQGAISINQRSLLLLVLFQYCNCNVICGG